MTWKQFIPALLGLWLVIGGAEETLSPSLFRGLQKVEELQREGRYAQSLKRLQRLSRQAESDLAKALVQTYLAYAYGGLDRLEEAARASRAALNQASLPERLQPELWFLLGQIELQRERFRQAAEALGRGIQAQASPNPQDYYLLAYADYRLHRYGDAIDSLRRALALNDSPPEDWYRLLLASYLESNRYREAEELLKNLLARHPSDQVLWRQLVALYLDRDRHHEGLATLVAAYHTGKLKQDTLFSIVRLYTHVGIPEKAARLIRQWRSDKRLPSDLKTLRLEAQLWRMARERSASAKTFRQVAEASGRGQDWLTLVRIYMELAAWRDAAEAAQKALQSGVEAPAEARLLLGVAAYRAGRLEMAARALEVARRSEEFASQADYWLQCVRGERQCR
ncbi:MAG: tetratricopeptide repeat protein [Methylohalobius sp. ZOD2]|nr:tetratricopeptide repeat protein [Methylothermaceae bacterium]